MNNKPMFQIVKVNRENSALYITQKNGKQTRRQVKNSWLENFLANLNNPRNHKKFFQVCRNDVTYIYVAA